MPDASETTYVRGPAPPQQSRTASFEFKQWSHGHTGSGYARWRSWEHNPTSPRDGKEDVYVAVHRLCAVAWLLPDDDREGFLSHLDGRDVHHELGFPSANVEDGLALVDHGTHSEVTQAQMRAWGADAKRQAHDDGPRERDVCGRCGDDADVLCESVDWDGRRCVSCAQIDSDGAEIEVL